MRTVRTTVVEGMMVVVVTRAPLLTTIEVVAEELYCTDGRAISISGHSVRLYCSNAMQHPVFPTI